MKTLICALTLSLTALSGNALAAGDAAAGEAKSATCAACHGPAGKSMNDMWPNLAGQKAGYIQKQLNDFKAGNRKDPLMGAQAAALSDQDIADLAAYYSAQ